MNLDIKLPVSLTARDWYDLDAGKCIRIAFGEHEVALIPHTFWQPNDDEIGRIAGEWLADRLGLKA